MNGKESRRRIAAKLLKINIAIELLNFHSVQRESVRLLFIYKNFRKAILGPFIILYFRYHYCVLHSDNILFMGKLMLCLISVFFTVSPKWTDMELG